MEVPATKKKVSAPQERATLRVLYELYCDAVRTSSDPEEDEPEIVKTEAIWDSKSRQLTPKVVAIIQRTSAVNFGGKTPGNIINRLLNDKLKKLGFISSPDDGGCGEYLLNIEAIKEVIHTCL